MGTVKADYEKLGTLTADISNNVPYVSIKKQKTSISGSSVAMTEFSNQYAAYKTAVDSFVSLATADITALKGAIAEIKQTDENSVAKR